MVVTGAILVGLLLTGRGPGEPHQPAPTYENDDFEVPEVNRAPGAAPQPADWPQTDEWLLRNALYNHQVKIPVRCENEQIDPRTATVPEVERYLGNLMVCLVRVWGPTIDQAGFKIHRPSVTVFTEPIQTRCGTMKDNVNAFYCSGDQQVYFGSDRYKGYPEELWNRVSFDVTLAHEFGHLIQHRVGIHGGVRQYSIKLGETNEGKAYGRRTELQADCLAGQFLNSVAKARGTDEEERRQFQAARYAAGSQRENSTHGRRETRQKWIATGLATPQIGRCNSFSAPAGEVR